MIEVTHNAAASRFEARAEGQLSIAEYRQRGSVLVMHHTLVPPALRGHGVAAALVEQAFRHAREHGLKIDPVCSYVARYMARHPETEALRA